MILTYIFSSCESSDLKAINDKLAGVKSHLESQVKAFRCVVEKHFTTLKMIEISKCYPAVKDFKDGLRDMSFYCDSICRLTSGVAVIASRVEQGQFVEAANHRIAYPNTKKRRGAHPLVKKLELNEFFNVFFKEKILSLVIECKRNDCVKEDKEALLGPLAEASSESSREMV